MALTVVFIIVFGIAILIPTVWAIIGLATGNTRYWPAIVGAAWGLVLMLITVIGMAIDWGGCSSTSATSGEAIRCATGDNLTECEPDVWAVECGRSAPAACGTLPANSYCPLGSRPVFVFCERMQDGGVKQPWATWSDLSFIAAGIWLLWFMQFFVRTGTRRDGPTTVETTGELQNPMLEIGWLSVAYCLIVIFMGPPSMWFHASLKEWGGWFDSMSVVFWLMFNACYVLYALAFTMWGRGRGHARRITVLLVWGTFVIVFGIIAAIFPGARLIGYFISGGLWGAAELAYVIVGAACRNVVYRRTWWLFILNLALLAVTMTIWLFWNDGIVSATNCQERESFPGHAVFHILASFSTILTYISFASEKRISGSA
jgi:hypothetical protein